MNSQIGPLVSKSCTRDHVVYVSDAEDPASHTTIVRIGLREDAGDPLISSFYVATVSVDATDGSLNIRRQRLQKGST
jgi:hypothetical protein